MSIALHIERLILDGLEGHDPAQLQAAIEAELTRLLREGGATAFPAHGAALPTLAAPAIGAPASAPRQLGAQIARSLHASFGTLAQAPTDGKQGTP